MCFILNFHLFTERQNVYNFVYDVSQIQEVKEDYERLIKKHLKQIKDRQRDHDKNHKDLQESGAEIERLNNEILVSTAAHT